MKKVLGNVLFVFSFIFLFLINVDDNVQASEFKQESITPLILEDTNSFAPLSVDPGAGAFVHVAGDILVTNNTIISDYLGHAGIVAPSGNHVIHTAGKNLKPTMITLTDWYKRYPNTQVIRSNTPSERIQAANWAKAYYVDGAGKNTEYKITANPKDLTYTYCSEIVWQSYYYGANKAYLVNVNTNPSIPTIITPYDFISISTYTHKYNGFSLVAKYGNW